MTKRQLLSSLLLIATSGLLLNFFVQNEPNMYPKLHSYTENIKSAMNQIPIERRKELDALSVYIRSKLDRKDTAKLTFICTHNSRRSHLSQVWAATAAAEYGLEHVETYSGGTEATAFNPRAVKALKSAGFHIEKSGNGNPVYSVKYASNSPEMKCWSKVFEDPANPSTDFAAVMTCSHADEACPIVLGADARFSIPYEDPKAADNTAEEEARYAERSAQIAAEMYYTMSKIRLH